jgi:hypothetical protein
MRQIYPFTDAKTIATHLKKPDRFAAVIDALDLIMKSGFDVYDFTRKDPVLFYQIQDAPALDDIYRTLNLSMSDLLRKFKHLNEELPSQAKIPTAAHDMAQAVDQKYDWLKWLLTDKIDIDLLIQFVSIEKFRELLEKITLNACISASQLKAIDAVHSPASATARVAVSSCYRWNDHLMSQKGIRDVIRQ